jgi:site-specific recombinase XerD
MASRSAERMTFLQVQRADLEDALQRLGTRQHARRKKTAQNIERVLEIQRFLGANLISGRCDHVLRHTFASHFMMNGGNILTLQRILGHANVTMTMRYSHLSPEHLQEAKNLNPLGRLTLR